MHELESWIERMDKMEAAREINPIFFWKLNAPRMWHLGVRRVFVYNSWIFLLHMCGETDWIWFFNPLSTDVILGSAKNFYVYLNNFAPYTRGNGYFNSYNENLLYYLFHVRILNYSLLHFREYHLSRDAYSHRRIYYLLEEFIVPSLIICFFQATECKRKLIIEYIDFHSSIFKPERYSVTLHKIF
jgi:hypothetical protein